MQFSMDILLITNDINLIEKTEAIADIENSIIVGIEKIKKKEYKYILIDEENFILESKYVHLLDLNKGNIAILGYNMFDEFLVINKDDFSIYNMEIYFEDIEYFPPEDEDILSEDDYEKNLELNLILEKLLDPNIDIEIILKEMELLEKEHLYELFYFMPTAAKERLLKTHNNKIKNLYRIYSFRNKINKLIKKEKSPRR